MNAIDLLLKDHKEIRQYFKEFEQAGDSKEKKQEAAKKAIQELHNHTQLEEQIYYPAVMEKGGKEMQDLIREGIEEHRVADFLIGRILDTPLADANYDARFKVLTESVQHHIQEEEKQIFPESKKFLAGDMDRISAKMEELEKQMEG
jgi:hemerythrin superfamily protein